MASREDLHTGPDHYFSAAPGGAATPRPLTVTLGGEPRLVQVADGVFSPDRIDTGTAVLLRSAPAPPPTGNLLDLGSGWGPIALTLALRSPQATVWAVDVNQRALDLVRRNAAAVGAPRVHPVTPEQIPADVGFDAIWSNPPIRIGKGALHELLMAYLPRLAPGATAYLVVQRHLGSDSLQTWLTGSLGVDFEVSRFASAKGYRVLAVRRDRRDHLADPA